MKHQFGAKQITSTGEWAKPQICTTVLFTRWNKTRESLRRYLVFPFLFLGFFHRPAPSGTVVGGAVRGSSSMCCSGGLVVGGGSDGCREVDDDGELGFADGWGATAAGNRVRVSIWGKWGL